MTTFSWDREDSGTARDTQVSADEQEFSHEKDDPDRISATNLCADSERLCSATGTPLRPPRSGKECRKDSDF